MMVGDVGDLRDIRHESILKNGNLIWDIEIVYPPSGYLT